MISNRTSAVRSFDFEITRMISDLIELLSVQLPLFINLFDKTNFHVSLSHPHSTTISLETRNLLKKSLIFCHFQILNSKSLFHLDFYLCEVKDDLEINLFRTYQFPNVFVFENFRIATCVTLDTDICFD